MERIENQTRRKISLKKKRRDLFKKAGELGVLCDARVACFVVSHSGTIRNFTTPSITEKEAIDQYQKAIGIDLWSEHYERMEKDLKILKETNLGLRREIGQRIGGHCLNDLSFDKLCALESEMEGSVAALRDCKYRKFRVQLDVCKLKLRHLENLRGNLLTLVAGNGGVVDNGGIYNYEDHHIVTAIMQRNQQNHDDDDDGEPESCLTIGSSIESVCTPCSVMNQHDATTFEDINI